jgi:transposase
MRISYVLVMHCEKMAATYMSFVKVLSLNFFLKDGNNSAEVIYKRLRGVYGDVCMGTSSVRRWVKHFKDGNTDIANQPSCGRPRTAATERNKQKVDELIRQDRRITFREIAEQLGVGHHAVQDMAEILGYRKFRSRWVPCLLTGTEGHKTAVKCSPIHPTVQIWPPQTTTCWGPWMIYLRGHQSRKQWEAGCEELERTSTAEASLRSCNAGRNALIGIEIL